MTMTDTTPTRLITQLTLRLLLAGMLAWSLPTIAAAMDNQMDGHGDTEAEFDESCAMGLADGQMVKTDCSVSWTDDDGCLLYTSDAADERG